MMIRKLNYNTQPGRRNDQRSSGSTEENGNRTEETQHGPSQSPPNIGVGQEHGKKLNKRPRWSREEIKEVLWCFTYIKEKTLGENYKEVYKLWGEEPSDENVYRCKSIVKPEELHLKSSKKNDF